MEFRLEIDQDRALNDVKDAIDKIRLDLPRDINEPIVQRIDVEGQSILTFAASSPGMTLEQLSWHVDDVIKRQLQGLKGVGRIERYGGVDREIRILLDPDRLLGLRHHRRRSQQPGTRDQRRPGRRPRRGRRTGAGDPHVGRRSPGR